MSYVRPLVGLQIMPNNLVEDYRLKAAYRFEHGMMY